MSTDSPDSPALALTTANPLISDWHAELARQVAGGELSAMTEATYRIGMRKLSDWLATTGTIATSKAIRDWKAAMLTTAKPASVNVWLSGVRSFYSWAVANGRMADNPTANVKGAKRTGTTQHHQRDALTDTEICRLLDLPLSKRDRAIITVFAYTGARQIELHRADLADLRTKEGAQVLAVQGKGHTSKDDVIVLAHDDVQAALYEWLAERGRAPGPLFESQSPRTTGGRLSLRGIRQIVKDAYLAAGIVGERKTTHSLRHSAISNVVRNGTIQQAQAMARHANIATTGIYITEMNRIADAGERVINYRHEGAK